jgi:modulator of FtsH protease
LPRDGKSRTVARMGEFSTAGWANFLAAETGAAAALSGLVFVAISINLEKILAVPHLPGRAAETLAMLVGALIVCGFSLVPDQPMGLLGAELLLAGAAVWLFPTVNQIRRHAHITREFLWRSVLVAVLGQAAAVPFMVAGALLLAGHESGLYWLVPGVTFSFVAGVLNAWVLIIEIVR